MQITLNIADDLATRLQRQSSVQGRSLSDMLATLLHEHFSRDNTDVAVRVTTRPDRTRRNHTPQEIKTYLDKISPPFRLGPLPGKTDVNYNHLSDELETEYYLEKLQRLAR